VLYKLSSRHEKLHHHPESGNSVFADPSVHVVCNICIVSRNRLVHCSIAFAYVHTKFKSMHMPHAVPNNLQCIHPRFKKVAFKCEVTCPQNIAASYRLHAFYFSFLHPIDAFAVNYLAAFLVIDHDFWSENRHWMRWCNFPNHNDIRMVIAHIPFPITFFVPLTSDNSSHFDPVWNISNWQSD